MLTYNKNVKNKWPENEFGQYPIEVDGHKAIMELAEREIELEGMKIREVRKKSEGSHQTSILTTNRKISITWIAVYMFSRCCQEIFFKYLRQEYDIERMMYYLVKQINEQNVNRALEKAPQYLKKQAGQNGQINQLKDEEQKLLEQRKNRPYKIEVKNMPEDIRYTKLDIEGKLFQNIKNDMLSGRDNLGVFAQ